MLILGDCIEILKSMESNSVDSLVTDPPAGIAFMRREWDSDKGGRNQWIGWMREIMQECLRVMKPGAHGLVWALPRTSHWTATALEDAGFRIKDSIQHIFGSGFPKSHSCKNIGRPELGSALKPAVEIWWLVQKPLEKSLTIDKNVLKHGTGALNIDASRIKTRENLGRFNKLDNGMFGVGVGAITFVGIPIENQARFPANLILSHNSDCVEVGTKKVVATSGKASKSGLTETEARSWKNTSLAVINRTRFGDEDGTETVTEFQCTPGCAVKELDEQSLTGGMHSAGSKRKAGTANQNKLAGMACSYDTGHNENNGMRFGDSGGASRFFYCAKASKREPNETFDQDKSIFGIGYSGGNSPRIGDSGGASRFFYCAKASKRERNEGLDGMPEKNSGGMSGTLDGSLKTGSSNKRNNLNRNHHPTVKPIKLMSYLITMVTPPNGLVLDPFCGSGSTGVASLKKGFRFIGIEKDKEYFEIAEKRINHTKVVEE